MHENSKIADLQENIEAIRYKLNLIDSAIAIAGDEQKLNWYIQRLELQERLEEYSNELAQCKDLISDSTALVGSEKMMSEAEADAALNALLYCTPATNELNWDAEAADAMLNELLKKDASAFLVETEPAPFVAQNPSVYCADEISAAEAMLDAFLLASSPAPAEENDESKSKKDFVAELNDYGQPFVQSQRAQDNKAILSVEDYLQLRCEAEQLIAEAKKKLEWANAESERIKREAERIRLNTESDRAMFVAEMELERGRRREEDVLLKKQLQKEKIRLAEKIAKRKAEITALRNGLQEVKDRESAFVLREKFFSIQTVLDDEERLSPEITYLLSKSLDDINYSLELSQLKRKIAWFAKRTMHRRHAVPKMEATTNFSPQHSQPSVYKKRSAYAPLSCSDGIKSASSTRRRTPLSPNEPKFYKPEQ